jgi:hypothetical protein
VGDGEVGGKERLQVEWENAKGKTVGRNMDKDMRGLCNVSPHAFVASCVKEGGKRSCIYFVYRLLNTISSSTLPPFHPSST